MLEYVQVAYSCVVINIELEEDLTVSGKSNVNVYAMVYMG